MTGREPDSLAPGGEFVTRNEPSPVTICLSTSRKQIYLEMGPLSTKSPKVTPRPRDVCTQRKLAAHAQADTSKDLRSNSFDLPLWPFTLYCRASSLTWQVMLLVLLCLHFSLTTARPLVIGSAFSDSGAAVLDITKPDALPSQSQEAAVYSVGLFNVPMAWYIFVLYAVEVLIGLGYSLWTMFLQQPRRLWLYLLGALFLTISIVWTAIDCTTQSKWRYLAQATWIMLAIMFVTESSIGICRQALYAWTVIGFAGLLILIAFGIGQKLDLRNVPDWLMGCHKAMPMLFTSWAMVVSWLFHWKINTNQLNTDDIDNEAYEMGRVDPSTIHSNEVENDGGHRPGDVDDAPA